MGRAFVNERDTMTDLIDSKAEVDSERTKDYLIFRQIDANKFNLDEVRYTTLKDRGSSDHNKRKKRRRVKLDMSPVARIQPIEYDMDKME